MNRARKLWKASLRFKRTIERVQPNKNLQNQWRRSGQKAKLFILPLASVVQPHNLKLQLMQQYLLVRSSHEVDFLYGSCAGKR